MTKQTKKAKQTKEQDHVDEQEAAVVYHFFWRKESPFSQWHPSPYKLDGYKYNCAEQGMMHGKALLFNDMETAEQIMAAETPRQHRDFGRLVQGFDDEQWKQHREDIVYRNSVAKFTQNEHLKEALLETIGLLVEASPNDQIWGIGLSEEKAKKLPRSKWRGSNLLGHILTRVREEIRENS